MQITFAIGFHVKSRGKKTPNDISLQYVTHVNLNNVKTQPHYLELPVNEKLSGNRAHVPLLPKDQRVHRILAGNLSELDVHPIVQSREPTNIKMIQWMQRETAKLQIQRGRWEHRKQHSDSHSERVVQLKREVFPLKMTKYERSLNQRRRNFSLLV